MNAQGRTTTSSFLGLFSRFFTRHEETGDVSDLMFTPFEAVRELERRQKDPELKKKIEDFLQNDIPEYLKDGPVIYMARHIVTPNFETLRFINLMRELGLRVIISQDSRGLFVSQNLIKRALCKLPVCRRVTQKAGKLNEHYQNITIADFNKIDGKPFRDIETVWGENLIDFHTRLFSELNLRTVETPDDADWLDRHHRGNLLEHYKVLLTLFVVHGIFFENYNANDDHEIHFIKEILRPACRFVEEKFGYRPIITQIFPQSIESYDFWISYPSQVLSIVRESMRKRK
jgi:hypothetical protein